MAYPETINLPFNAEVLRERFTQKKPGELEDKEEGFWVILQGDSMLLEEDSLPFGALSPDLMPAERAILFGIWEGQPIRVLTRSRHEPIPYPYRAVSTADLSDDMLTLTGLARQIVYWERMSSRCSRCGAEMERIPMTWGKRCTDCSHEHYPHIHPCVIVLVRKGDEILLARKPEWPAGRYSLVAGFVDFGESLEECVVREVFEETGLKVHNIRYVGSQNWPFPSQLMTGFVAEYLGGDIQVDLAELEDARWFPQGVMPTMLPPRRSIARWIIDRFAQGNSEWP